MKRSVKTKSPTVLSSKFIGLYASGDCSGPGWGNSGYIHAVYEDVLETGEIRVRNGPAVRTSAYAKGAAYTAFVALYAEFATLAQTVKEDEDFG